MKPIPITRIVMLLFLFVGLSLTCSCSSDDDDASSSTDDTGGTGDDDTAPDDTADDSGDDALDDTQDDTSADDDLDDSADDTADDDTGIDDTGDDSADDSADDTGDDDTFVSPDVCDDPSLIQPNECANGMMEIYCWFGAPILVAGVEYTQADAVALCLNSTDAEWIAVKNCVGEIVLDAAAVSLHNFIGCLSDQGIPWQYPEIFDPLAWKSDIPAPWTQKDAALNFWSYAENSYAFNEMTGAVVVPSLPGFHGSVSFMYFDMMYYGVLFGRGDSTFFDDTQLAFSMDGFAFWSYPTTILPWHQSATMSPI